MKKFIALAVALLAAYAFGRFSAPEKVKIETKLVEVEKKIEKKETDRQNNKKTTTVTEIKPDGTKTITKVTTDESTTKTNTGSIEQSVKIDEKLNETTNSSSKVTISALAGVNPFRIDQGVDLGAMVSKPVLGPVTIGVFGFKSGSMGASVGLTF